MCRSFNVSLFLRLPTLYFLSLNKGGKPEEGKYGEEEGRDRGRERGRKEGGKEEEREGNKKGRHLVRILT